MNITGNELIWAINEVYRKIYDLAGEPMYSLGNNLLIDPDGRQEFMERAEKLLKKGGRAG